MTQDIRGGYMSGDMRHETEAAYTGLDASKLIMIHEVSTRKFSGLFYAINLVFCFMYEHLGII